MSKPKVIWWIRRDIRLDDNNILIQASKKGDVIPVFIFIPSLLKTFECDDRRKGFISEALDELDKQLAPFHVCRYQGEPCDIFHMLFVQEKITSVVSAKAHSLVMKEHEDKVRQICLSHHVSFETHEETLLVSPREISPYKVFTPFFKAWSKIPKLPPLKASFVSWGTLPSHTLPKYGHTLPFSANVSSKISLEEYANERNQLTYQTTRMSGYLRFGIVGVRTLYEQSVDCIAYQSELAWREFWFHIMYHFPWTKEKEFLEKRRGLSWENNESYFQAWCQGQTGYPIIDAAMRELSLTGFMHGRARMIVASFLTKDLLIDWRWGEQYFRQQLWDYDEAVNIGNWQWSASVGADPKPLRIFNPILQAQRFDPEALYIKHWIPELAHVEPYKLHDPLKYTLPWYRPIVNHTIQQRKAKVLYKNEPNLFEEMTFS